MSPQKSREPKARPFPWPCPNCYASTIVPTVIEYKAKVKQDGVLHELHFPAIEVPRCPTCGETVITTAVDEQINDALRSKLRLLTPAQIRAGIEKLGLQQQEFAGQLGVAAETISRWVNGALIQSRAMDNLLRLFFESEEVRNLLQRRFVPEPPPPVNRMDPAFNRINRKNYEGVSGRNYVSPSSN